MTTAISFVLKILYWSIVWASGLGWVVLIQEEGDILSRLNKERLFISTVLFVGAVGGIFIDKLLQHIYIHETPYRDKSKLPFSGGVLWALIWTTTFIIATTFSSSSCSGNYSCWNLGFLGKLIAIIFGTPVVGLYTAFIGSLGTIIYVDIFGLGEDLRR